jgi:surface polysaccharide O-acyltransferase-like enzyme
MSAAIKTDPSKELIALHYARIIACIGVIALHVTGFRPESYFSGHLAEWWTRILVTSYSIWAVPVFVIISGALLLDKNKKESNAVFFKKRLLRVGIPALFWIPFYYIFIQYPGQSIFTWQHLSDVLLTGNVGHLYYFFVILELYLLTPLFRSLLHRLSRRKYLLMTLAFIVICILWRQLPLTPTFFVIYVGYYLLGPILIKIPSTPRLVRISAAVFFISGLTLALLFYLITVLNTFNQRDVLFRTNNPLAVLLAISVFILIYCSKLLPSLTQKISLPILRQISSATLGVYILHPLIIKYLVELFIWLGFSSLNIFIPWYLRLLLIPVVFAITLIPVLILKRIKYLSALV